MIHYPKSFDWLLLTAITWLAWLLLGPVLTIPLQIPINYNEGWNAMFGTRAVTASAGPLYPGPGSFVFNNYPPLGFLVVGAAGQYVFGDMIVAGRIIALAALLGSAALLGLCVRQLGGTVRGGCAAAVLLALFMCDYYRTYVAMDDPQWLAHATMLGGLALLLRRNAVTRLRTGSLPTGQIASACLLMVAGGFVKHNLVALPVAVSLWLLWLNRRAALVWALAGAAGLAVGLVATWAAFGPAALAGILHHRRLFRAVLMVHSFERLAPMLGMAVIAAALLRRRTLGDGAVLAALFAGIALVTGIAQRMGEGVYYNAHFETLIALCLAFGLALTPAFGAPVRWLGRSFGPAALLFAALMPMVGALPWHIPIAWHAIADRKAQEEAWRPMIARLAAAGGPVGCHFMSICYWAGNPSRVDLFNLTQSVLAGGPLDEFQAFVAQRGFALFEDEPTSFLHRDAVRELGYDPVMGVFAGLYAPVYAGPKRTVLLAPVAKAP